MNKNSVKVWFTLNWMYWSLAKMSSLQTEKSSGAELSWSSDSKIAPEIRGQLKGKYFITRGSGDFWLVRRVSEFLKWGERTRSSGGLILYLCVCRETLHWFNQSVLNGATIHVTCITVSGCDSCSFRSDASSPPVAAVWTSRLSECCWAPPDSSLCTIFDPSWL